MTPCRVARVQNEPSVGRLLVAIEVLAVLPFRHNLLKAVLVHLVSSFHLEWRTMR